MQVDEKELLARTLQQDASAYGDIVERYKNAIYYHCFSIVHDEDVAEDIAQETFIAGYYKLNTFDQSRKLSTWLFKIATNLALSHIRSSKRVQPLTDEYCDTLISDRTSQTEESENAELHRIVEKLEPKYRTVISLYYWQGKSYSEIAEIMGKPEGSIKGWINRAKLQLRKELS